MSVVALLLFRCYFCSENYAEGKCPRSGWGPGRALGTASFVSPVCCFARLFSGGFCTQPPPFTYAIRPKCSTGLVVIGGFLSQRDLSVWVASERKPNRLQTICSVRKQLQIYEQAGAVLFGVVRCTVRCTLLSVLCPLPSALCAATKHADEVVLSGWRK